MTDWHERWDEGRIGFHLPDVNATLRAHVGKLVTEPARVLVPLAGKTLDLTFLAEQGHTAVGVELVEKAAREYFAERELVPAARRAPHLVLEAGGVELHVADMLTVPAAELGAIDAVWDRAAMVALPPDARVVYAGRLLELLPVGGRLLLVAFGYDQTRMDGPPYAVHDEEIRAHYDASGRLERLEHTVADGPGRFAEAGIAFSESVWLFERG